MGLWPFGKSKADIEAASRVVVLRARDAVPMRAKVSVKFEEPLTQVAADELAETCADLVRSIVREAPAATAVLGCEVALAAEVLARLPKDGPRARSIEIAGLHIVGDPGSSQKPAEPGAWLRSPPAVSAGDRPTPVHPVPSSKPAVPAGGPSAQAPPPAAARAWQAAPGVDPNAITAKVPRSRFAAAQAEASGAEASGAATPNAAPSPAAADTAAPHTAAPHTAAPHTAVPQPPLSRPRAVDPFASTAVSPSLAARTRPSSRPPPPVSFTPSRGMVAVPPSQPGPRSSSSSRFAAVRPPDSSVTGPSSAGPGSGPASFTPSSKGASNRPPPAALAARRRVVASRLLLPASAGPYEVARGLTPLFRDTAGRILVAFLRAYDLTVVRRVPFDAIEGDILASLTAPSDGAPGAYMASHAAELNRWRDALGAGKLDRLQREANLAAAAAGYQALTAEGVSESLANAVIDGLSGSAFGDPEMLMELGRYLFPANETISAEALANMIEIAGEGMPPGLETALDPLFFSLREELGAAALIARDVMAGASY